MMGIPRLPTAVLSTLLLAAVSGCNNDPIIFPPPTPAGIPAQPAPLNTANQDRVLQVRAPAVDVLFVIDNSCSMAEEQVLLTDNFPQFMTYFLGSGLDYHIGVISTDMVAHGGLLRAAEGNRYIDPDTEDPVAVFQQMATIGDDGHFEERGRDAVYSAIELRRDEPENEGFYRPGAGLELIFVTDENDDSSIQTLPEFQEWLLNLKFDPELTQAHAIVAPIQGFDECLEALEPGTDYINLANFTDGEFFSICEPDWAPVLDRIGLAVSGPKLEYFLSQLPVIDSIEVTVVTPMGVTLEYEECIAGEEQENPDCEVLYNTARNSVTFFASEPPPFSEVYIDYTIRENFAPDALD